MRLSSRRIKCSKFRQEEDTKDQYYYNDERRRKCKHTYHEFIMNEYTTIRNDGDQEDDKEKDQRSRHTISNNNDYKYRQIITTTLL